MKLKKLFLFIIFIVLPMKGFGNEELLKILQKEDLLGVINHLEVSLKDGVKDGCWTNVGETKSLIIKKLKNLGIKSYSDSLLGHTPDTGKLTMLVRGGKISSDVCLVSIHFELSVNVFSSLEFTKSEESFEIWTDVDIYERTGMLISDNSTNTDILETIVNIIDKLSIKILLSKRKEEVNSLSEKIKSSVAHNENYPLTLTKDEVNEIIKNSK